MDVDADSLLKQLQGGPLSLFSEWSAKSIPETSGIYTIWETDAFLYVGVARDSKGGLRGRLGSHRSGRRAGDQFCVYVCDRLVLPTLIPRDLCDIWQGKSLLDVRIRSYIRERLSYRFATTDVMAAKRLETRVKREGLQGVRPLLNPDTNAQQEANL